MDNLKEFDELVKNVVKNISEGYTTDYDNPPVLAKEIHLSKNAEEIFNRRYRRRDSSNNYIETIPDTYMRVANYLAQAERTEEAKEFYRNVFYNMLVDLEFIPNAPTWTGADTPLGQLAACFVLPIEDDMGSHPDGIFSSLRNAALIQQTGGGNGFSFSRLRPRGDVVKSSMGKATGPVGFLQVYDEAFGEIAQGGVRRGANMAVLRVDHPDIREFIKAKAEEGHVKNFNISVGITDTFMKAVKDDTDFDLINPRNDEVWETVKAREIYDMIIDYAWKNGEPGVLFIDEANRYNPVPQQYSLEATNPCGEQWLGPYENCCLGHININSHVNNGKVDWAYLAHSTWKGVRFLDNVVTMNGYVPAVPQLKEAAWKNRRIGLGFTGLADAMYKLGIRYGSDKGQEFAAQITEFIRFHSMKASVALAAEREPFPGITGSIYDYESMSWTPPVSLKPYEHNWGRPVIDWNEVVEGIRMNGIRNSTQMTVAPTGSTSTVLGVEGYGCEPVFALAYYRNVYQAAGMDENLTLRYISPMFEKQLNETDIPKEQKESIIDEIIEKGTCQHIDILPEEMRNTFVVSSDITPEEHVLMQSSIQAFIDNSISKTINFPENATREDVSKAYFMAWETKSKGLTVYRAGSRQEIVLETSETKKKKDQNGEVVEVTKEIKEEVSYVIKPRPRILSGDTHKMPTPLGNMYITVNRETDDSYHEVFINVGKAGSDVRADSEAIGRLISLIFRLGSANSNQRMKAIIRELAGISSGMISGFNGDRVLSVPDAIAKALRKIDDGSVSEKQSSMELFDKHLQDEILKKSEVTVHQESPQDNVMDEPTDAANREMCPLCGNYSVMKVEGCKKCNPQIGGCGAYSAC